MSSMSRVVAGIAGFVTGLALSACAIPSAAPHTGHTPDAQPASVHNAQDIAFARHMIPHHQQALDMADMVPTHTANATLQSVAIHIKTDQQAEIVTLNNFLARWGEPLHDHHETMGMEGSMPMQGMVDTETMTKLSLLTGTDFDTLWITSMVSHHEGALTMAQDEIAHGQNADAIKAAQIIVVYQEREIAYMRDLLATSQ
jgi:uncharacterized protein (DUF305 family)